MPLVRLRRDLDRDRSLRCGDGCPAKYSSTNERAQPDRVEDLGTAVRLDTVEIPIFDITFRMPLSTALM